MDFGWNQPSSTSKLYAHVAYSLDYMCEFPDKKCETEEEKARRRTNKSLQVKSSK